MHNNTNNIQGTIGYLGLEVFWLSCTPDEQNSLVQYWRNCLGNSPDSSPIRGKILYSSETKYGYISSMIAWTVSDKNYSLADKLINYGSSLHIDRKEIVSIHFFYQNSAECYYKQRELRMDALNLTIQFCLKDIDLFSKYFYELKSSFGGEFPRIVTFQRLAIIYEKNKQYYEAIKICELAIKYGLTDSTKGGYFARLDKLKKKITI